MSNGESGGDAASEPLKYALEAGKRQEPRCERVGYEPFEFTRTNIGRFTTRIGSSGT